MTLFSPYLRGRKCCNESFAKPVAPTLPLRQGEYHEVGRGYVYLSLSIFHFLLSIFRFLLSAFRFLFISYPLPLRFAQRRNGNCSPQMAQKHIQCFF